MDSNRLKALIDLVSSSPIAELEIVDGEERVRIVKAMDAPSSAPVGGADTAADVAESSATEPVEGHVVAATTYGVLHLSPSPEGTPFVSVGDEVQAGQKLCLIEAMKVFNTVSSDRAGRISAVLATSGSEVHAGQPLFQIQ